MGEQLSIKAEKSELTLREEVSYDILKRIKGNLEVLSILPFEEISAVSIKLILRSIFSDLISGLYLLSRGDEELNIALFRLDYEHFLSMKKWAKCHDNLISSQSLVQQLNIAYKDFIGKSKPEKLSISSMANELNKLNGGISELSNLYSDSLAPLHYFSVVHESIAWSSCSSAELASSLIHEAKLTLSSLNLLLLKTKMLHFVLESTYF